MSLTKRILFGAAASWFSRGVAIFLGMVLLPVLFRTLPKEELGVWLLLGQSWATLGILDLGFGVTLTRRIAFAKSRSGSLTEALLNWETRMELADLTATGVRLYRVLAVLSFAVSFGLGFIYLGAVPLKTVDLPSVWASWGILCLSQSLVVWSTPWTCLLQGIGYIGWDAILASFVNALTLLGQIAVALCGGGLVGLAAVSAIGALAQRVVIVGFARRNQPEIFDLRGKWCSKTVREMLPLACRAWLTALGSMLLLYTDQFIITSMEGAKELPSYRAAWVLVHNITVVGVTFAAASGVFVSHLWRCSELQQVHRIVERNVRFGWLTMLAGAAVLLYAGDSLFAIWLGAGNFIGYQILVVIIIAETLEAQSYIVSCASRATGDEAFAWSYLLAGTLKLVLSIALAQAFGLLGVALGTLIALLLTNHWYVPWRGMWALRYSRRRLVMHTVLPALAWFAAVLASLWTLDFWLAMTRPWLHVAVAFFVVAMFFVAAVWLFVVEPEHRSLIRSRFGRTLRFA